MVRGRLKIVNNSSQSLLITLRGVVRVKRRQQKQRSACVGHVHYAGHVSQFADR